MSEEKPRKPSRGNYFVIYYVDVEKSKEVKILEFKSKRDMHVKLSKMKQESIIQIIKGRKQELTVKLVYQVI